MRSLATSIAAASLLLAFVGVSSANAEILLAASRTGDIQVSSSSYQPVPLTKGSQTSLNFEVKEKGTVVITYNAECVATGPDVGWLSVRILVDGNPVNPKTGPNFAFCSVGLDFNWAAVARQSFVNLKPGQHTVQVEALLQGAATDGRLDDTSIVIFQ